MFTLKMHSVVDLITNSSSVIYTDYTNTVEAVKDLMSEILSAMEEEVSVDDVIFVDTIKDSYWYFDQYDSLMSDTSKEDYDPLPEDWNTQYYQYRAGIIEKPEWMTFIEQNSNSYGWQKDNDILIRAKEPRFEGIVKKIEAVIFSPSQDAGYDG